MVKPNIVFVFADQLRYQATGFGGDPNVRTPHLDAFADESLNFDNATSGCPVCCPARASLLTGQYPHQHGVFVNDVCLGNSAVSMAEVARHSGYDTAYIGKWHLDGHGRSSYIPAERRHGFQIFEALECTHDYNQSPYYVDNDPHRRLWEGYDAEAQTRSAQRYITEHETGKPYLLVLSWGPPHNPYDTAPEIFRRMYAPDRLTLRENVAVGLEEQARIDLAGYYAHTSALDALMGDLLKTIADAGDAENTIIVFWSDHGDMLGSHGQWRKQRPWEESIHVPLLIRYPAMFCWQGKHIQSPINTPDILPTLLGLCELPIPTSASGHDYSMHLRGESTAPADEVLLACYQPFGEYTRMHHDGREYRGVRTARHTYVRDLTEPWLLYDNISDPYQMDNMVGRSDAKELQSELDYKLTNLLQRYGDTFLPGDEYLRQWGYVVDATGTVPYTN